MGDGDSSVNASPLPRDITEDAFFEEERASSPITAGPIKNPTTHVTRNMFDAGTTIDAWFARRIDFLNPLQDPAIALRLENWPQEQNTFKVFAPAAMTIFGDSTTERPVTLFIGPGEEMNRHGLRSAFYRDGKSVLVAIPGKETGNVFGFGISQEQLVSIFAQVGIIGVPRVKIIAGFSTGYRGANGIINNTKSVRVPAAANTPTGSNPGLGLDLSQVQKLIYYDAFYQADEPKDGAVSGFNTNRALKAIHSETKGMCELVIYDVTGGGTPNPLAAVIPTGMPQRHIKVKPFIAQYNALILARVIDMAIKDGYTTATEVKSFGGAAVMALIDAGLPARGTVGAQAGSGATDVTSWTTLAMAQPASAKGQVLVEKLISPQKLLGWACVDRLGKPSFAEMQHDAHLFEFCWEHLVPT